MKMQVMTALMDCECQLMEITKKAVEDTFKGERIEAEIKAQVDQAIRECIRDLSGNFEVKRAISRMVVTAIDNRTEKILNKTYPQRKKRAKKNLPEEKS